MSLPQSRTFITSLINSLTPPIPSETTTTTAAANTTTSNPLKQATETTKSTLLTLHILYPNELLPALDLLDRELVTRLYTSSRGAAAPSVSVGVQNTLLPPPPPSSSKQDAKIKRPQEYNHAIYHVQSAQRQASATTHSRFRDATAATTSTSTSSTHYYEVRTSSWSCSCPAFVFSAFPLIADTAATDTTTADTATTENDNGNNDDNNHHHHHQQQQQQEYTEKKNYWQQQEQKEWAVGGLSLGKTKVPMCKHLLACVLVERTDLFAGHVKIKSKEQVSVEELAGWAAGWGD